MYEQREGELFSTKRLKLVAHAKTECVRITLEMPLTTKEGNGQPQRNNLGLL